MLEISLVGAPVDSGQRRAGCLMGPAAYRCAGLAESLQKLGHKVTDLGDLSGDVISAAICSNVAVDQLPATLGWTNALRHCVSDALAAGQMPLVMGGDHSLALGSVAGAAEYAARIGKPLFLLWLDAHSDFLGGLMTPDVALDAMEAIFASMAARVQSQPKGHQRQARRT